jgi:hypothetical protein
MKRFILGLPMGSGAVVALAAGVWLTIACTGFYNVAATDPHSDTKRWTIEKNASASCCAQNFSHLRAW